MEKTLHGGGEKLSHRNGIESDRHAMHCHAIIALQEREMWHMDKAKHPLNSDSDVIRQHARDAYLKPARRKGEKTFAVNVGAVHKTLALNNRVPLVCAALKSKKFLSENGLKLVSKTGPP